MDVTLDKEYQDELKGYELEKRVFEREISINRREFIKQLESGLGEQMNNFESYKKRKPSRVRIFWNKMKRALWSV